MNFALCLFDERAKRGASTSRQLGPLKHVTPAFSRLLPTRVSDSWRPHTMCARTPSRIPSDGGAGRTSRTPSRIPSDKGAGRIRERPAGARGQTRAWCLYTQGSPKSVSERAQSGPLDEERVTQGTCVLVARQDLLNTIESKKLQCCPTEK